MPHYKNHEINVVGTWHQNVHRKPWLIEKIIFGKSVTLRRETKNRYDKNAVAVDLDGHPLGYIPKEQAVSLAPILDRGSSYESAVKQKRRNRRRVEILLAFTTYPIKRPHPLARRSTKKNRPRRNRIIDTPTGKPFK